MKLSRRQLAQSLALGTAATAILPAQPPLSRAESDPEFDRARDSLRANVLMVRSVPLPMAIEPASMFQAKG